MSGNDAQQMAQQTPPAATKVIPAPKEKKYYGGYTVGSNPGTMLNTTGSRSTFLS
jgi:hypothetical protein